MPDDEGSLIPSSLETAHGRLDLPVFLPDGTRGVVRSLDASDVETCGIRAVVVNALHLSHSPGTSVVKAAGGIHKFMGWNRPVLSDSGGFQAYSLGARSGAKAKVTDRGIAYRYAGSGENDTLTPEGTINVQMDLGADIVVCLDECTHPDAPREEQERSVERTIRWAGECRAEFYRRLDREPPAGPRPLLFAVVQGGNDRTLRTRCAEALVAMGFDGYGYGGWPVDDEGLLIDAVALTAELLPKDKPRMGLGIGMPPNIRDCWRMGYSLFDCVLPTRDARHGRLYIMKGEGLEGDFFGFLGIEKEAFVRDNSPVDPACDCLTCRRYSRGYLHHLFQIEDRLAWRLASIHNLRFYSRLIERLKAAGK